MSKQVGGDHYERCAIQPWSIIQRNGLDYWEGTMLKYLLRHRRKNGHEDLMKLQHFLIYALEHYDELYKGKQNVPTITQERQFPKVNELGILQLQPSTDSSSPLPPNCPWGVASITAPTHDGCIHDGN